MPNMSTKEVNYLKDLLSWELLACKKCYQYGHQETDPSHQQIFFGTAHMHQENYLRLLNYVEQFDKRQGGQGH